MWGARDEVLYLNHYKQLVHYVATTYTLYMPNPLPVGTLLRFTETDTRFTETDTKRVALCRVEAVEPKRFDYQYATEVTVVLGELPDQRFEGRVEIVGE